MAVVEMVDNISAAIDGNDYSVGLFIDFSKAFDTMDHKILFNKHYHYCIRGVALDWFKSYFKIVPSMLIIMDSSHLNLILSVAFHKDKYWDQFYF